MDKLKCISPSNDTMFSLDAKSIFSNVPIQGALDILKKTLSKFHYFATEIYEILNFVNLYVRQTPFILNVIFYSKIEHLSMGNPLLSLLCYIYMHCFEEKLFNVYKFCYWFRYIDDTFVLVPSNADIFLMYFLWPIRLTLVFNSLLK